MIVADKEKTINKSIEIVDKILSLMNEETRSFQCEDDPAENIYLTLHVMGGVGASLLLVLKNYGETHGIKKLDIKSVKKCVNKIINENIELNMRINK